MQVKYYNDCYLFDLSMQKWTRVTPQPGAAVPSPRSGFQIASDSAAGMVYLYGGYFKKKARPRARARVGRRTCAGGWWCAGVRVGFGEQAAG